MINFKSLAFAAAAAVMLVSCTKELGTVGSGPVSGTKKVTLTATASVKTTLSSDRKYLDWVEGDSFNVFADVDGSIADPTFTGASQEFVLEVPENATKLYTVYPAKSGNTKTEAKVTIPANQTQASAGVLNGNNCPMVGSGEINKDNTASIGFMPAFGLLAINVYSRDNSFDKKVTKVVVTPYSAEGAPATGFCGTATVDLTDDSDAPEFDGTAESVTVTLAEPYQVGYFETGTPADFGGEIYVALAPQAYYNFKVEVYTDDDYVYSAVLPISDAYDFTEYDFASVSFNLANGNIKEINLNDYYSLYENGIDFKICDQVINKTNYPEATLAVPNSMNTPIGTAGLYFVDNSKTKREWSYASNRTKNIADGVILIGRYKNYPQPVLAMTHPDGGCFVFEGDAMLLNYRIECSHSSYGVFQSNKGLANSGKQNHRFQDCTLVNPNGYLTSFNQTTYCVPKSMTFDNCIIRVAKSLVYGGNKTGNIPDKLENITFNQTVIAPADASRYQVNGSIIDMDGVISATDTPANLDKLNVTMSYCTVFDYGTADKSRGLIEFTTCESINMDHVAFYHSTVKDFKGTSFYTIYGTVANTLQTGGISISACYVNDPDPSLSTQGTGNKSGLVGNPQIRPWSASMNKATQTVIIEDVDGENDYFPVKVISKGEEKAGGASYNKKYWVKVPATE